MANTRKKKQWSDFSTGQKTRVIVLGMVQVSLMISALVDIRHRPADEINGSKRLWTMLAFVNWIGPIAYFTVGRKR